MQADRAAHRFATLFPRLYLRFYRRLPPGTFRLSPEAIALLEHLAATGPLTVSEAAGHFGRSQSATSELLNRLEQRRLVERMADERDRRRILVWLTERGQEELARSRQVLSLELLEAAMSQMQQEDRENLLASVEALLATPILHGDSEGAPEARNP